MYLLTLLSLIGAAVCRTLDTIVEESHADRYVLPKNILPSFYDVILYLDPDNEAYFEGSVDIRIIPQTDTNEIVLQAMEMQINAADIEVFNEFQPTNNLYSSHTLASDDTHLLKIQLSETIPAARVHTLRFKQFRGQYATNMFGIYVSTYTNAAGQTEKLITSQLQPTFARRAFPCFDEPFFKARFRTTIYARPTYNVVESNMPLRPNDDLKKPDVQGWVKHEFQDTPLMSTYLLAYLVSNFQSVSNEANPIYSVPFKVWSRPGTQATAAFALEFGQQNMVELEKYTEFKYDVPKLDKAAVPDFAAGAMENWGLVIYREVALLVTDGVTTTATRQNVGRIICHENVHQWFGNEVSPVSWTYTWLNEGFANFFENFATDLVKPDWRMMDQFVLALQNVLQSDAVLSVNPMTHPVYSPSEIIGTFNAVAYQKSGSVIRMMQHFLTPEVFRKGLAIYIKKHSREAVVPSQLYSALQQALDESDHTIPFQIIDVMSRWAYQGGFPVLTVTRSAAAANSITVAQERYLTDNKLTSPDRWHVPINWVLSTNPDFSDTKPQAWVRPTFPALSFDIPGLTQADWYILNKQQTGYYRVNYENSNWLALAGALDTDHSVIHVLNRANLLDDAFNLARNGRLNYQIALSLSRYLVKEKDYIPWGAINPSFTYLDSVLSGSSIYSLFQQYVRQLTAPLYEELGFIAADGEEHVTPYHRNIILDLNCRYGNAECTSTAQSLLEGFKNNPEQPLNPDIQNLVYCAGLRGGSVENFDFLWERYLSSQDHSEQSILLNALGCTSNAERRSFYMQQVISDTSPVREQDRHTILVSVTNASPESTEAALDFVIENFAAIQPRVQGLTGTTNILNAFARRLTTQEHSSKIDELSSRHQSILTAGELASIAGIRENIAASITWNTDNAAIVEDWLQDNYGNGGGDDDIGSGEEPDDEDNGSPALLSGFVILISFVVTVFNH
uniref:Aminopeptidase n=1 Tax=Spodoptera exigua TaxID=7107 RepID=Q4G6A4_SPOEX|nr:midgut class 2 aminopeptidase N [Spodoptera exigua]